MKRKKYEVDLYKKSNISISCYADSEKEARSILESTVKDSEEYILKFKPCFNIKGRKMGESCIEMNQSQVQQLDDIDNSIHELCKIMLNDSNLNWDMNIIGDVAVAVAEVLVRKGLKVYYPAIIENVDTGERHIINYYGEE